MARTSMVGKERQSLTATTARSVTRALDGVAQLEEYLAKRTSDAERMLRATERALYQAQSEHQHIPYGAARVIVCWEAMQVERAIRCVLARQPEERARYGYELASDYVKRSNFSGFGDLNKESAEPLSEVVAFWYGYADTLAAGTGTGGARGHKEQP